MQNAFLKRCFIVFALSLFLSNCGGNNNNGEICNDGADNDDNGLTDCEDSESCSNDPACQDFENCTDGEDNNNDGLIDCDDPTCQKDEACFNEEFPDNCVDGVDNDNDGSFDCEDSDCEDAPACNQEPADCTDAINAFVDSDCDALSDQAECIATYGANQAQTNPEIPDSDGDGINDGIEVGSNETVPNSLCGNNVPLDNDSLFHNRSYQSRY